MKYSEEQIIQAMKGTAGIINQVRNNLLKLDPVGISRQGVHDRISKSARLREVLREETESVGDIVETKFIQALEDGEKWAVREWFKYKGKNRGYVAYQQVDKRVVDDFSDLEDKDLERLANATSEDNQSADRTSEAQE